MPFIECLLHCGRVVLFWLPLNLKSTSELKLFFYLDLSDSSLLPTPAKSRQPTQELPLYIHTSLLLFSDKVQNCVVQVLFNNSFDAVINFKKIFSYYPVLWRYRVLENIHFCSQHSRCVALLTSGWVSVRVCNITTSGNYFESKGDIISSCYL